MMELISYFGFSRMPFGRDLAPGMLHRHTAHNEAVARIGWCIAERRIGVITGEVGAGKTVAVRAALAALDRSRHSIIYLPDPTVGVRGIHHRIVASLGGQPLTHHATLAPQAADALAAEHAERGRTATVVVEEAHLLITTNWRPSACSPTMISIRRARSPACSSASPPCGGG
jgi:type II secretory pathway predicted ATPase ExeA